jgi:hypothetical protein
MTTTLATVLSAIMHRMRTAPPPAAKHTIVRMSRPRRVPRTLGVRRPMKEQAFMITSYEFLSVSESIVYKENREVSSGYR